LRKLKDATQRRAERVRELLEAVKNLSPLAVLFDPNPQPPPPQGEGEKDSALTPPSLLGKGAGGLGSSLATVPAFYKLGFQYDPAAFGLSRELFVKALRAEGIAFDAGFRALHVGRSPSRFRAAGELTHAADAHNRCVILHHPILSGATSDVQQVADAVAKVYRYRDDLERP
jgi:hypothetical protein